MQKKLLCQNQKGEGKIPTPFIFLTPNIFISKWRIINMSLFSTLGKLLVYSKLKGDIKKMNQVEPEMASLMIGYQYYTKELEKLLPEFCKRKPNSILCKTRANIKIHK